jgi:O-antigen/teichoic acid export membrane protein
MNMTPNKKEIFLNQINNMYLKNIIIFTIVYISFILFNSIFNIIDQEISYIVLIISFFIIIFNYANHMLTNILRVTGKINTLSTLLIITSIATASIVFTLLYYKYFNIVLFIAILIPSFIYFTIYYSLYAKSKFIFRKKKYKNLLRISLPTMFASLVTTAIIFTDKVFLTTYLSLAEVGIYEIAYKFGMMYDIFIVQVFNTIYVAFLLRKLKENFTKYFKFNLILIYINMFFVPIFIYYFLSTELLDYLRYLIGIEFIPSLQYIKYIVIYFVLVHSLSMLSIFFLYSKRTKMILYGSIIIFIINIISNYFLIPTYGIMGSLYSSYISICGVVILMTIYLIIEEERKKVG